MKVIKFGAKWCVGCKTMGPRFKKIEKENKWLKAEYIGIDEHPEAMNKYQILSLPTFIFFNKDEKEIKRLSGVIGKSKLMEEFLEVKNK